MSCLSAVRSASIQRARVTARHRADSAAPTKKPLTPKLDDHKIDQEVSVAAIAIGERVDLHQAVLQAHRNLIRLIRLIFDPGLGIVEQLAQRYWNRKVINPDGELAGANSRPTVFHSFRSPQ
jgi:hypothetical protein